MDSHSPHSVLTRRHSSEAELKDSVLDSLAVTMLIRGILIITPTGILYGRTSVIRSPIITAPRTPGTARGPTTANIANIKLTTAIKPKRLLN